MYFVYFNSLHVCDEHCFYILIKYIIAIIIH